MALLSPVKDGTARTLSAKAGVRYGTFSRRRCPEERDAGRRG